jgi:hypothetical protein
MSKDLMHRRIFRILISAAAILTAGSVCRAQSSILPAARSSDALVTRGAEPSWMWVHAGVAMQVAGSAADWATSWKQPEANPWLAEPGGAYQGTFYHAGTVRKAGLSAGLAAASYVLAWKWPKARRYIGIFNMSIGAGYGAAAVSNTLRGPR